MKKSTKAKKKCAAPSKSVKSKGKLKSKVLKSKVFFNSDTNKRKKIFKRKQYTEEKMKNAIRALHAGVSIRKAASAYGVPVSTLARRNKTPDVVPKKGSPPQMLPITVENDIVYWIISRAKLGYPVSKTELLDSVQKYVRSMKLETKFTDDRPGRHWYEAFRNRHINISIRKPQKLDESRANVSRDELEEWYDEQEKYLRSKNLLDISPNRVYNCDETNVMMCPDSERVFAEKGATSVYKIDDGGKLSRTILFTYNAQGDRAPPMIMLKYKEPGSVPSKVVKNVPKEWGLGVSETGWMCTETFYEYVLNVFHPWLLKQKVEFPILLYLDNHASHVTLPLVTFCRAQQIELIGLVPHSTHICQPLDVAFFKPFKQAWKATVAAWKLENKVLKIKPEEFPIVLKISVDNMQNEAKIVRNGFKASGLFPFDFSAIDFNVLDKTKGDKIYNKKDINNDDIERRKSHLQIFEKNISSDVLKDFINHLPNETWSGNTEYKALYEYWILIRNQSSDKKSKKSIEIKSVEKMPENFRLNIISKDNIISVKSRDNISPVISQEYVGPNFDMDLNLALNSDFIYEPNPNIPEEMINISNDPIEIVFVNSYGDNSNLHENIIQQKSNEGNVNDTLFSHNNSTPEIDQVNDQTCSSQSLFILYLLILTISYK